MDTGLQDKVIVVTGASGGIGAAIARAFLREGARVVLHYRRGREQALGLQREAGQGRALCVQGDLAREADVRRLIRRAVARFGRVDTLVANAGSWEVREVPLHEMTLRQWDFTMGNVLTPTFLSLREFLRQVGVQGWGNAVLIGSTAAVFGEAGHADYAAAKAAITHGLLRSMKNELARLAPHTAGYCGGRINCVCPGWTVVPRTAPKLGNPDSVKRVVSTMALPQLARPEDIAAAVVFLSSDVLARHVTGQTLVVAGGMEGRLLWRPEEVDPGLA